MNPDGTNQRKLTTGAYDDREPVWLHDGRRVAFSSDRGDPLGSNYNIWTLDVETGALVQLDDAPGGRLDADLVGQRRRHRLRVDLRRWSQGLRRAVTRRPRNARSRTSAWTIDAASWVPGGTVVAHVTQGTASRLEIDGKAITGDENAFPFVELGQRHRVLLHGRRQDLEAERGRRVVHRRAVHGHAAGHAGRYTRVKRDFDSRTPRKTLGIALAAALSPDASKAAFAAVGDIWVMPVGGAAVNITKDRFLDTDPAWSPDGTKLVDPSHKGGKLLQLWVRDTASGQERQLTNLTTQPQGASWSNDGTRIAFFDVDGMWRRANISVVDVASGKATRLTTRFLARQHHVVARWRARGRGDGVELLHPLP